MTFVFLGIAIISEVFASSMLKLTEGFTKLWPTVAVALGYGLAFYFLSLSLLSLPLGTAYAIWAGLGTSLTALIGVLLYQEKLNRKKLLGLLAIVSGVILLNLANSL